MSRVVLMYQLPVLVEVEIDDDSGRGRVVEVREDNDHIEFDNYGWWNDGTDDPYQTQLDEEDPRFKQALAIAEDFASPWPARQAL